MGLDREDLEPLAALASWYGHPTSGYPMALLATTVLAAHAQHPNGIQPNELLLAVIEARAELWEPDRR